MAIPLSDDRRVDILRQLQAFFQESFERDLSAFQAEELLDFFLGATGPALYNQGVEDAKTWLQERLLDLDVDVHASEEGRLGHGE